MANDAKNVSKPSKGKPKTIAGYLASALDMEEQISGGVYQDYLDAKNWPANLKPKSFKTIRDYLTTLIEDTEKHKKMLSDLNRL